MPDSCARYVRAGCEHVFVQTIDTNLRGNVAEAGVVFRAIRAGIEVLRPRAEHVRYDLALDVGGRIYRVQCKSASLKDGAVVVRLKTCRRTSNGYLRTLYSEAEIDFIAAFCPENDGCWLIPIDRVDGQSQIQLRIRPARNGQRAAINFAAEFEFDGAVAQLARASAWHAEGHRFESGQLHFSDPAVITVGSEAFGAHPARFLQRARDGESFLVTRRSRPMAQVIPPG